MAHVSKKRLLVGGFAIFFFSTFQFSCIRWCNVVKTEKHKSTVTLTANGTRQELLFEEWRDDLKAHLAESFVRKYRVNWNSTEGSRIDHDTVWGIAKDWVTYEQVVPEFTPNLGKHNKFHSLNI